jgi:hypothetical protein
MFYEVLAVPAGEIFHIRGFDPDVAERPWDSLSERLAPEATLRAHTETVAIPANSQKIVRFLADRFILESAELERIGV